MPEGRATLDLGKDRNRIIGRETNDDMMIVLFAGVGWEIERLPTGVPLNTSL